MKKHDPEKLLVLFKKSKKVVQAFVDKFQAQHGRKPHGEDLSNAPEYVRVCIKNCKKIKAHMEKIGKQELFTKKLVNSEKYDFFRQIAICVLILLKINRRIFT